MADQIFIRAGRLNKTFALKGHIRAFIEPQVADRIKKLTSLFLLIKNNYVPYFIDECELNPSGHCMFHFEEINDKTAADLLVGKDIYLDESTLKKSKRYQSLSDFIGFKLVDEKMGDLGSLENITELPNHDVGHFSYQHKEILFPWNEEVILDIDKRKKTIRLRLPDGLLDIYLK